MNKNQNRLIATARQYALVTFLGLGMSFAVAKTAVNTQKVESMDEQEWLYDGVGDPTTPTSYSLNDPNDPLATQCEGAEEVCGIKAPASDLNPDEPKILPAHGNRISEGNTNHNDVFMKD